MSAILLFGRLSFYKIFLALIYGFCRQKILFCLDLIDRRLLQDDSAVN